MPSLLSLHVTSHNSTPAMRKREIDEIPTAPPALLLMLGEFASGAKWEDVRKWIKAIVSDLKEQSFAFEPQNVSRSEPLDPISFDVHLHGALDLLSRDVCVMPKCRVAAERLARSFGLIADQEWLTDHLSTEVMGMGRPTNAAIERLMQHAVALAPLLPLIEARIIRFRSPWIATWKQLGSENFFLTVCCVAIGCLKAVSPEMPGGTVATNHNSRLKSSHNLAR